MNVPLESSSVTNSRGGLVLYRSQLLNETIGSLDEKTRCIQCQHRCVGSS